MRSAIENARKVLINKDAHPYCSCYCGRRAAMIGVLRGERRQGNARLAEALFELRANNVVTLEFFGPLGTRCNGRSLKATNPLAAAQYRELLSLWHETEDRMFAVPAFVSAAGFYADQRDGANLVPAARSSCYSARNRTRKPARDQGVLAETAWYHGDLTNAVALMREAIEGTIVLERLWRWLFTSPFRAEAGDRGSTT